MGVRADDTRYGSSIAQISSALHVLEMGSARTIVHYP